jgi:hypothetical protein
LKALLLDQPRLGRPQEISPLQRAQIVVFAERKVFRSAFTVVASH